MREKLESVKSWPFRRKFYTIYDAEKKRLSTAGLGSCLWAVRYWLRTGETRPGQRGAGKRAMVGCGGAGEERLALLSL